MRSPDIVAYGIGGDELGLPTADLRPVYDFVASQGMHRLIHAGEIGGPGTGPRSRGNAGRRAHRPRHRRNARRTHLDFIAARNIPLEFCPTSNLRTGALARQVNRPTAGYEQHPLPSIFRRGLPVTLSSDDPAMFETTREPGVRARAAHGNDAGGARATGRSQLPCILSSSPRKRSAMLDKFHSGVAALGLV